MLRPKTKLKHGDLLLVQRDLKTGIQSYHFDITPVEYGVMGLVMVHWAFLEAAIFIRTVALCRRARVRVPPEAKERRFNVRHRLLRQMVETGLKAQRTKDYYIAILNRITAAAGYRQRVAHNQWSYNPRRPEQLWATGVHGGKTEPFSPAKLAAHAEMLGELSYALLNPPGSDAIKRRMDERRYQADGFAYVSRRFLLMLQELARQTPDPPPESRE